MMFLFEECATCKAKTGTTRLCDGCVNNRASISRLRLLLEGGFQLMLNAPRDALGVVWVEAVREVLGKPESTGR